MTRCDCCDVLVVKNLNRWFKEKWVDVSRKDPKTGKMIPAFAMDGKGKMAKGGMTKKKKGYAKGGMKMKKKGMARGGMKKGYAAGGMTVPQLRAAAKAKGYKIMKG